jgi:hypothetical protein
LHWLTTLEAWQMLLQMLLLLLLLAVLQVKG